MGILWEYTGVIWESYYVNFMEMIWDFYGNDMGFLWECDGNDMGFLWELYGIFVGI